MTLTPTDLTEIALIVVAVIVLAHRDDPRMGEWIKTHWSGTVGAWFARRRVVGPMTARRHSKIRVGAPDEHSTGIMVSRRDINTGSWT